MADVRKIEPLAPEELRLILDAHIAVVDFGDLYQRMESGNWKNADGKPATKNTWKQVNAMAARQTETQHLNVGMGRPVPSRGGGSYC